jgi:apolipoprotein N-acyltransferase
LLAVLSGALYVLGYPGVGLWPLAFVALVPVLRALTLVTRARHALLVGVAFGAAMQLFGAHWLIGTLHAFARLPLVLSVLAYALLCLTQSLQLALFVLLASAIERRGRDPIAYAPLCLGAAELVTPQLFPSHFAASLQPVPWLLQLGDIGGPILSSMWLAACNAALYRVLWPRAAGVEVAASTAWRGRLRALGAFAALLAVALGYAALRIPSIDARSAAAPKLALAIVQPDAPPFQRPADRNPFRERLIEQSKRVEQVSNPDLFVWPETALQYVLPAGTTSVRQLLGTLATPVLFGGLGHEIVDGRARLYNSAYLADASGHVLGRADKQRLIPFAEYIPFGQHAPRLYDLLPNTGAFTAGERARALPFRGQRIAALICYEDVIARHVRDVVVATRPGLLVNLSNDVWFGDSAELPLHHAFAALRAVEHRRYLVRADNVGISAVVDPVGRVVVQTRPFIPATLHAEVAWLDQDTIYDRIGDVVAWLAVTAFALSLWRRPTSRSRSTATGAA